MNRRTGRHCRGTQPADDLPGTGLKATQQPANVGQPRSKQQPQTMLAGLSPCSAGKWGSAVVLAARKAGADLPNPVSTPAIAFAMPCPLPFSTFLPPFSSILLCPLFIPCAPGSTVCKLQDCPVGSCNTGLQWRPVRRFIGDFYPFSCRVHDPGP